MRVTDAVAVEETNPVIAVQTPTKSKPSWLLGLAVVGLLTCVAILISGYHSGIEDDAIYLPGIKKILNPSLYPHDAEFFATQTRAFLMLRAVAASSRITHISIGWIQFFWQILSVALLIAGCWYVAGRCFQKLWDRVGAVALVAGLLTMPVAGTSLYIADQHLHPRTLACAGVLFAIGAVLERRYWLAAICSAVALAVHPLMAAFGIAYVIVLAMPIERWMPDEGTDQVLQRYRARAREAVTLAALPLPIILHPNAAWKEAALTRSYFFLWRWEWYEWVGIFAPMALLWWFATLAEKMDSPTLARLCKRLVVYSVLASIAGLIVGVPAKLNWLAPIQPMRHLQLVYLLMLLAAGGFLTHYVLKNRVWRWLVLFVPLCGGMLYAQRESFATSTHIELPGEYATNRWVRCFQWIRQNTPEAAYFAVDPKYMSKADEENFGFRAIAERSKLADYSKDAAVVAVAPDLAPKWKSQVEALRGYENFTREDFLRLKSQFGIDWALVEKPGAGLSCPYQQDGLSVCRVN